MSRLLLPAALATLVATVACNDTTRPDPTYQVAYDTTSVYALNASPITAPAGITLSLTPFYSSAARVDAAFDVDVAFDIDAQGRAVAIPVQLLAPENSLTHTTGLRFTSTSFENVDQPDKANYKFDSTLVVPVGQTLLIARQVVYPCYYGYNSQNVYYGKLVVDSVKPALHQIYLRVAGNPNCGYTSLKAGVPKD